MRTQIYAFMYIWYLGVCVCVCTRARFSVPIHRISATLTYRGFLSLSIPHTVRKSWATETNSPLTIAEIRPWNRHWRGHGSFKLYLSNFTGAFSPLRQIYSNFPINFRASRCVNAHFLIAYYTHIYLSSRDRRKELKEPDRNILRSTKTVSVISFLTW